MRFLALSALLVAGAAVVAPPLLHAWQSEGSSGKEVAMATEPGANLPEGGVEEGDTAAPSQPASAVEAGTEQAVPLPDLRFRPPFSLNDCRRLLEMGSQSLPEGPQGAETHDRASVLRLIEAVRNYLVARDDLTSSLANYSWERIERGKVSKGPLDNEEFRFDMDDEIPRRVTALSFEVERGDALLHFLAIYDPEDELIADFEGLKTNPVTLRHSLPRREVFHLWRPSDIGRIELTYSQSNPGDPRDPMVFIHAGRSNQPEYGKSAVFFLRRAEARLRQERPSEAREDLLSAREQIERWRRDRQRR